MNSRKSTLPLVFGGVLVLLAFAVSRGTAAKDAAPSGAASARGGEVSTPRPDASIAAKLADPSPVDSVESEASAAGGSPEGQPHGGAAASAFPVAIPEDLIEQSSLLPENVVEVTTVDPQGRFLPNVKLELLRERKSVSEGNESSKYEGISNAQGKARFDALTQGGDTQYRLVAVQGNVRYGTRPFAVDGPFGIRVVFHVYPVISNIREAMVAGRSFLFVEPRDDVLHIEVISELHNLGASIWVPDVELRLPEGWKAFSTTPNDSDLRIDKTDEGIKLVGVVSPGQHSVGYSFQVPTDNQSLVELTLPLWPRTAEARVATVIRSGLELEVDGYPAAELVQSNGQKPMLMTGRSYGADAKGPPSEVHLSLRGLPVVGPGRWIAAALAALAALGALVFVWQQRGSKGPGTVIGSVEKEARERLLQELADLTAAHRQGAIGDETFEEASQTLIAACVRLERQLVSIEN